MPSLSFASSNQVEVNQNEGEDGRTFRSYHAVEAILPPLQINAQKTLLTVESTSSDVHQEISAETPAELALDPESMSAQENSDAGSDNFAYNPLVDSPEALRAQQWIKSGIALLSIGGILGIGALGMGSTDPCNLSAGNGCQKTARDRAALTMGIPGAMLMAGGVAMLIVGKRQKRRLHLQLQLGQTGASTAVTVQF